MQAQLVSYPLQWQPGELTITIGAEDHVLGVEVLRTARGVDEPVPDSPSLLVLERSVADRSRFNRLSIMLVDQGDFVPETAQYLGCLRRANTSLVLYAFLVDLDQRASIQAQNGRSEASAER